MTTEAEKYSIDFLILEQIHDQLQTIVDFVENHRKDCLDTTQPLLNRVNPTLLDLMQGIDNRAVQVKKSLATLLLREEEATKLDNQLRKLGDKNGKKTK